MSAPFPLPAGIPKPTEVLFFSNGNAAVGGADDQTIPFYGIGYHGDTVRALEMFGFNWRELAVMGSPQTPRRFTDDQLEALLVHKWTVDPCVFEREGEIVWIEPDGTEHGAPGQWRQYPLPWPDSAAAALAAARQKGAK